jgi:hypothetical protein
MRQKCRRGRAAKLVPAEGRRLVGLVTAAVRHVADRVDVDVAIVAHRRRPASCVPSGAQLRTGPPELGSTGCHRRTPSQASPSPVCQRSRHHPQLSTHTPREAVHGTVRGRASRAAPARSRSSDRSFPKGFGLTAATNLCSSSHLTAISKEAVDLSPNELDQARVSTTAGF